MTDASPALGKVFEIDEAQIQAHHGQVLRVTVKESLNATLEAQALCGLPVSIGLSLSLLSRCRDLLFGAPLLTAWWLRCGAQPVLHHTAAEWPPIAQEQR